MLTPILRVICGLLMIIISLTGGALLVLTPLRDVPAARDGRQLVVAGITRDAHPGDTIVELVDRSLENSVYIKTTRGNWSSRNLVIAQAIKTTTDTGRTVLEAQQTCRISLESSQLLTLIGCTQPLLFPKGASWIGAVIGLGLILLTVFHWTLQFLRFATLTVVGLTAGATFAVGLQKVGLLSAQAVIGFAALTMIVNVLAARFRHFPRTR